MDSVPYEPRRTPPQRQRSGARRSSRRYRGSPLISMLFFPCAILYHELLLRIFDKDIPFFGAALFRILLFSVAAGFLVFFILDVIPNKKVSRWIGGVLIFLFIVILCVERGMRASFGIYYGILSAAKTAGGALEDFSGGIIDITLSILPFILLSLIPLLLFIIMRRTVIYERGQQWLIRIFIVFFAIIAQLFGYMFSNIGEAKADYTTDFEANSGIRSFGLVTTVRLDFQYGIFGQPVADVGGFVETDPSDPPSGSPSDISSDPSGSDASDPSGTGVSDPTGTTEPIVYGYNTLDIDFDALAANTSNKTIKSMHEYFGSLTPSQQNPYTGMFKDKNLILLTAESFSPYVVDPELTPTLYKLTHEAFVFNNFYQPDWSQSTCGGEFSVTTGVIPNWVNGDIAARQSINNSMPTTLGNMFRALGYSTPAWHNGSYDYYKRNQYLTTFGYDFKGENGGGFDLEFDGWPRSDLEMIQKTCDEYINAYVQTGQKFHAYYMTISGHGNWTWAKNHQAQKYRTLVEQKYPNLSEPCQSYIASNIDLDRGLEYLVQRLEAAGIADDTLIVMTADHYPYFLGNGNNVQGDTTDYYNELTQALIGETDTEAVTSRYRNTLLMWSGCITEPIVVDTPCSSIDIVPTVANLFGLKYDSRLYSGRDIFATNYVANEYSSSIPLVIFADTTPMKGNSWITPAGTYESSTKTFTPAPGVTLADQDAYVTSVKRLVSGKIQNAKLIVSQDYYAKVFG